MPRECRGRSAARALAVMVLDPAISAWLARTDPKALDQARMALEPFGWPDEGALRRKLLDG